MCKWVPAWVTPEESEVRQRVWLVQIAVAQASGVPLAILMAPERGGVEDAFARQTAMYLCRLVFALSLREIASGFGRDRSTARHAIRRIEEAREHALIDRALAIIESMLKNSGGTDV